MAKRGIGTNTHGHGTHRRGKGRKGGKGYAGVYKQNWIRTIKGGKLLDGKGSPGKIGHFGKFGFSRGRLSQVPTTVNLSWVDLHFDKVANLTELGIEKLLGSGKLTQPLTIKVSSWSAKAEEKVKAAKGKLEN